MQMINDLKERRDSLIELMDSSQNSTEFAKENSSNLYALGLTVYSKSFCVDSLIYNSFALSYLDETVSLHPEQLKVVEKICENEAVVLSAPTSFGKTYCIFEYIAREKPQNVVLVVPTLALVEEYRQKIIKKFTKVFGKYKVYTNVLEGIKIDFNNYNIFILTHERIISGLDLKIFSSIDFLVIDEVYKLNTDISDDRVLVLNMAYYYMSKISKKYVLLAPFISSIEDIDKLEKKPIFISTEFSPVVNKVHTIDIVKEKDRPIVCKSIIDSQIKSNDKTLIYFPTVVSLYSYVNEIVVEEPIIPIENENVQYFLEWAKKEIHSEWSIVKALERGYLIHNGQIQIGTRIFLLDLFDEFDSGFDKMLCTASLLEGVNTPAKNIIITRPSRRKNNTTDNFTAFDFYNLVGRTGRLYKHFIGNAYYIKGPKDPNFQLKDAKRKIRFELLDESKDIDVQLGIAQKHDDISRFYQELGISNEDYLKNIGTKIRIDNCINLFNDYKNVEKDLIKELRLLKTKYLYGRYNLLLILYKLCEKDLSLVKTKVFILNQLLNLNRLSIKTIVDEAYRHYANNPDFSISIDTLISTTIKLKAGDIEHNFYNKCCVILFFMEKRGILSEYLNIFKKSVLEPIEILYFTNSPLKKALFDMGIYEKDIDIIVRIIGDEFDDIQNLKKRLIQNSTRINDSVSFISKYIINSLNAR